MLAGADCSCEVVQRALGIAVVLVGRCAQAHQKLHQPRHRGHRAHRRGGLQAAVNSFWQEDGRRLLEEGDRLHQAAVRRQHAQAVDVCRGQRLRGGGAALPEGRRRHPVCGAVVAYRHVAGDDEGTLRQHSTRECFGVVGCPAGLVRVRARVQSADRVAADLEAARLHPRDEAVAGPAEAGERGAQLLLEGALSGSRRPENAGH
mmetsp:Transcript_15121/g.41589  ORF Transcript_15121/g.41589 Transcript_15121/m.41589 type:complete len:204 (+) Transcript_15121:3352-3963(+)